MSASITILETENVETKEQNDISDKLKDIINDYKKKCKDINQKEHLELMELLNDGEAGMYSILSNLIKKQKNINCCDNVDLSNFVLKSSIPPCSNVIPDKFKTLALDYNPNSIEEVEKYHPLRINDKFSIIYICIIILITMIIVLNLF